MWPYPLYMQYHAPNDGEGESSSLYESSSKDKDPCSVNQEQESNGEEDEEDSNASQVTFDMMGTFDSVLPYLNSHFHCISEDHPKI